MVRPSALPVLPHVLRGSKVPPVVRPGGSLWNAYLQVVRKRGLQLGVYLHRQSLIEPPSQPSRPPGARLDSQPPSLLSARPSSNTSGGPPPTIHDLGPLKPAQHAEIATRAPFIDSRKVMQAYFAVHCPNILGTALTKFASGPDKFAVSQSWGYKSSSLRNEEYLGLGAERLSAGNSTVGSSNSGSTQDGQPGAAAAAAGLASSSSQLSSSGNRGQVAASSSHRESLRCTVVLGLV